jgi:hypothetical protein
LDPAAARGDLRIRAAKRPFLEFPDARAGKNRMRVRIYEARQHYPRTRVNYFAAIIDERFNFVARTNAGDSSIDHQHGAVF